MGRVLITEPHPYHFEVIPGIAYYFHELGYKIDLLVRENYDHGDLFGRVPYGKDIHIYRYREISGFIHKLLSDELREYDFVFFSSLEYFHGMEKERILDHLHERIKSKYGLLGIYHNLDMVTDADIPCLKEGRIFSLTECKYKGFPLRLLSASYFGEFKKKEPLSKRRRILLIGGSNDRGLLEREIAKCPRKILKDVEISYIGKTDRKREFAVRVYDCILGTKIDKNRRNTGGSLNGWIHYRKCGSLSFQEMFEMIRSSDFIAFIREAGGLSAFSYGKTTGSKQLAAGFGKPFVSSVTFTKAFGFPQQACVSYERSFAEAVLRICRMDSEEYSKMAGEMELFLDSIRRKSLENLKDTIDCAMN